MAYNVWVHIEDADAETDVGEPELLETFPTLSQAQHFTASLLGETLDLEDEDYEDEDDEDAD